MTYLPLSYLLSSRAKIDIIRILLSKQNFSGRKIAVLSSTNPNSNKKALDFLIETGLVRRELIGNSFLYNINEKHFLYEPIAALFKEEEKIVNKIMKLACTFIEESAPKTIAGFISYHKNDIELTFIAHSFPAGELADIVYEKTGLKIFIKVVDILSIDSKSIENYEDRFYFWNNYKSIQKIVNSKNIIQTFFNF